MPACPPLTLLWIRGLLTWLTYTVTGLLAVSLSAPEEPFSPLYLAAGVGLAFTLGWGRWMLPAVGLGAATVMLAPVWLQGMPAQGHAAPSAALLGLALISGAGAALQAWTGWALARLGSQGGEAPRLPLDTPREIALFMLMAGPVASIVHPSVTVIAQILLGMLPLPQLPSAFIGGWVGHTMGALVATPMLLTLLGKPRSLWRPRRELVGVPLLVATVLLVLAVRQVQAWRTEREAAVFNHDVAATANAVNLRLNGFLDALAALNGIFEGSDQVSREEFARVSRYWIQSLKGIQAVGWNERVSMAGLAAFEAREHSEGLPHFKAFDTHDRKAPQGPELVLVRYIEPRQGNEPALGLNVLSRPAAREAYEQARREGRVIASRSFRMIQETGNQNDVVVYHPVYRGEPYTPQARVQANLGVVFLALRMEDTLAAMLQGRPSYLDACLVDATEHVAPGTQGHPMLAGSTEHCLEDRVGQESMHRAVTPMEFAGRQWRLVMWNVGPVPLVGHEATTWLLAVGGAAFAAALGSLLLVMTGHARRIEEAMEEARHQRAAAETANRAKSEFMSRMSHELRTPLNAVLGFAQLMEMDQHDPLPATQVSRVEQIQQAGWHLLDMIDDVLDISRIDTGTLRLQTEPLRIRDELTTSVKLMQAEAARHGVELILPNDVPSEWGVTADATRLRQIIGNLLSNAIKFNRQGGQVRLKVTRSEAGLEGATLHIAVEDTGMGMNAEQLNQLFQPFNRLGREQMAIGGTGIGLVVGRHLAASARDEAETV